MIFRKHLCTAKTGHGRSGPSLHFVHGFLWVFLIMLLYCSVNPVKESDKIEQPMFPVYNLAAMIPDSSGGFWASSHYNICKITCLKPPTPSRVVLCSQWYNAQRSMIFLDAAGKPTMISPQGIFRLSGDSSVSLIDNLWDYQAPGSQYLINPAIDPWGHCRYMKCRYYSGISIISIIDYATDTAEQKLVVTDTITLTAAVLASYGPYTSILFQNPDRSIGLRTYRDSSLIENTGLFKPTDSVYIQSMIQLDSCEYLFVYVGALLYARCATNVNMMTTMWHQFAAFKRTIRGELLYVNELNGQLSAVDQSDPVIFRSPREAWLRTDMGIFKATPQTISFTDFRVSNGVDRYSVCCFTRDNSTAYFDELTRRFLTTK